MFDKSDTEVASSKNGVEIDIHKFAMQSKLKSIVIGEQGEEEREIQKERRRKRKKEGRERYKRQLAISWCLDEEQGRKRASVEKRGPQRTFRAVHGLSYKVRHGNKKHSK